MSNFGDSTIVGPTTAFSEVSVATPNPIVQISAVYGFNDQMEKFEALGGTADVISPFFVCTNGTDPDGFGSITSRRQISYRPGQGLLARFTALYDTPVDLVVQHAGLFSNTDVLVFGYNGLDFGIIHQHNGFSEIQELTVVAPALGTENATVTVDGTAYVVALTAGTVQHTAFEIAESLNVQVPLYDFTSNNDQVVARSLLAATAGLFAFNSSTAVASWSSVSSGAPAEEDFIPQEDWNGHKLPDLDPSTGNVYQIQMQWLGFGAISFYIEDPSTCKFRLVHTIDYCNKNTVPSLSNPTLRVGWLAASNGGTTSVTLRGASAAGFIEGNILTTEGPRSFTAIKEDVGGTEVNLITLRSRLVFGDRRNRVETFARHISMATESTKTVVVRLYLNTTLDTEALFEYVDKDASIMEVSTTESTVTGGRLLSTAILATEGGIERSIEGDLPLLHPGDTFTITAEILGGGPESTVGVGFTWQEDI